MTSYNGDPGLKPLVVKLYTRMIAQRMFDIQDGYPISIVNPRDDKRNTGATEYRFKSIEQDNAMLIRRANAVFLNEVQNFERIYETDFQLAKFKGAKRATDISDSDLLLMQDQLHKLKLHPGRKHIHQILHFDKDIPAILSERCNGTLHTLRTSRPGLFECIPDLSPTWKKVGHELASAIQYIESRGMVHIDIKPGNVFFVWDPANKTQPIVKLGDFGLCHIKRGAVTYIKAEYHNLPIGDRTCMPKGWPKTNEDFENEITLNAETLCHAELAITMFRMLYVSEYPKWPNNTHNIEDQIDQASEFEWGKHLFSPHNNNNVLINCLLPMLMDWRELIHNDNNSLGLQQFLELSASHQP